MSSQKRFMSGVDRKLKSLDLHNYILSSTDLELLHAIMPLLSSISLEETYANFKVLPEAFKPAKLISKMMHTPTTDNCIDFQEYATANYQKITNMLYSVLVDSEFNLADYMIRRFTSHHSRCCYLGPHDQVISTYNVNWGEIERNIVPAAVGNAILALELANNYLLFNLSAILKYPSVQNLKLKGNYLPIRTDFFYFISQTFPNLRILVIEDCVWDFS
ncbi:hypothetical protein K501DRAFT_268605 [Backusella circina FSU 941]|nr:hypothetical protein K501DRAFT_268605 [Backusella circina FSU 941]